MFFLDAALGPEDYISPQLVIFAVVIAVVVAAAAFLIVKFAKKAKHADNTINDVDTEEK